MRVSPRTNTDRPRPHGGAGSPRRRWRRPAWVVLGVALAAGATPALAGVVSGPSSTTLQPGGSATTDTGTTFADGGGAATFTLARRPVGDSAYLGLELRRSTGSLYRTRARVYPDGAVDVSVSRVGAGVETSLGAVRVPLTVPVAGLPLRVEGSVAGAGPAQLRVRAWAAGTATPGWQLTVRDASALAGDGSARAWEYLSRSATASLTVTLGDLSAHAGTAATSTTAPPVTTPPVTATPASTSSSVTVPSVTPSPSVTTVPPSPTVPTAPAGSRLAAVLAASGADPAVRYPVPAGAVFVAPGGSDAAAGTEAAPLATVAAAVRAVPAGGTVVLRGGVYRQDAGTVAKRVTLQAYPGERPVLSGADVVRAWTASGGAWRATDWRSPFGQKDFRAEEVAAGSAAGQVEQAYRDGTALRQVLTRPQLVPGTFWVDPATLDLWVADDPAGAVMELSRRARGMALSGSAAGSVIRGLRFTAYAAPHLDNSGQLSVSASDVRIENSWFDHSSGAGLKIAGARTTVDHVTVADNGAEGMQGNRNHDSVVRNSQFLRSNTEGFLTAGCGGSCTIAGFKTAHTDNLQVLDNAFVDNASNGFWCDLGCTDAVITGNAVSGGGNGLYYEVSSRATITGNDVEGAALGVKISGSDHVTFADNLLVGNTQQFGVYDDARSSSTDAYSAGLGLTWNTTDVVLTGNTVTGTARTTMLLAANSTAQVVSAQMYATTSGNHVTGNQTMVWCTAVGACKGYPTIAAWSAVSGRGF